MEGFVGEWREVLSSQRQRPGCRLQQLWEGDWNSHIGQDAHERTPTQVGKFGSRQPTTTGGRQMQQWLTEDSVELQLADSFRPVRHRGTFQARTSKVWFELDTLLVSPALLPRVNSIRQFDSAVNGPQRKIVFHSAWPATIVMNSVQMKRQTQIPLALHRMRGHHKRSS